MLSAKQALGFKVLLTSDPSGHYPDVGCLSEIPKKNVPPFFKGLWCKVCASTARPQNSLKLRIRRSGGQHGVP
jgi:hypothetical protein